MRVLVSGASGLIGSHLTPALEAAGYQVCRLVRRLPAGEQNVFWNPATPPPLNGFEAAIHLAGESIMGRWTEAKKTRIRESRINGTRALARALANAGQRPRCLLTASAIGYYGSRGDEVLDENSQPGSGFLAQVVQDWEQSADPARAAGIRVVHLRTGLVLTGAGGALKTMLLPFRLGLGGRIGSGRQWMSWIALEDVIGAILFALRTQSVSGPVNLVGPASATNAEFTAVLAQRMHRPAFFTVPATAVKLLLGEMGESLLLSSQRVTPAKLLAGGYEFRYPGLRAALAAALG